jgi:hypothetical protein
VKNRLTHLGTAVSLVLLAAGSGQAAAATTLPGLGAHGSVIESPAGCGVIRSAVLGPSTDKQIRQQYDLAASAGLKIYVTEEGWQRVTRAAMIGAGFDPGSNFKRLSLYMQGVEQPLVVNDDSIEFYGQPLDTISSGARTYWLHLGNGAANRVPLSKAKSAGPLTASVAFSYEKTERSVFFAALVNNGDGQNFFGPFISSEPVGQQLHVANLDGGYGGNATLDVTIQGGSDGAHEIAIAVNGMTAGTVHLAAQEQKTFTLSVPQGWLIAGTNELTFTSLGGDDDISLAASARLTYQHLLRADAGELEAALPGGRLARIGGFPSSRVRAVDVTDPANAIELETSVVSDPLGGFAASFTPAGSGSRIVLAFDDSRVVTPSEMVANIPSSWSDKKGSADLLIISNAAFLQAAGALVPLRRQDNINAAVVDVEDLYDEFNFGVRGPEAIRSFLQSTLQWKVKPRWVLLVGDASIDPRNYLGLGAFDFVPTKLVPMVLLKTASDDWLADVDGDGYADFAIGRLPTRTPADAAVMLNKIIARGTPTAAWSNAVLSIADEPNTYDFPASAASAMTFVPASMTKQSILIANSASPTTDIINALDQGQLVFNYVGHGSNETWSNSLVFTSQDASALTNGNRLPFAVIMDCLNGYFHDVYSYSIAEALLENPNGGAVAVWASSTLAEPDGQEVMNRELFRLLFSTPGLTIGEAVNRAKRATSDVEVRKSWILFGDPSMRLQP